MTWKELFFSEQPGRADPALWPHVDSCGTHVDSCGTHGGLMWTHVDSCGNYHVALMWTHVALMWHSCEVCHILTHCQPLMWTDVGLMWTHVGLMWTHVSLSREGRPSSPHTALAGAICSHSSEFFTSKLLNSGLSCQQAALL